MRRLLLSLVLTFGLIAGYAQSPAVINCATMEQDIINRVKYPQMGTLRNFEDRIRVKTNEIAIRNRAGKTQATVITIPVIVHVVHTGEAVGTGLNISQAQVKAQLETLNEDFRRKAGTPGFNDNTVGADIEIEFCLSPVDENGVVLPEPGIHRVRGANTTWTRDQIEGSLKPQTIWNPNLFYNVWTLKFGGTESNLLGYAQFPDESKLEGLNDVGGSASTDGVVVQYSSFGNSLKGDFPVMTAPYNRGRTLTHETGHWLGLRHIWGDGPCASDFVGDTPAHLKQNTGCPTTNISCDNSGRPEMPQNYMDYSNDECMNIFTVGQKARILAVMELSPRRNVLTKANLCNSLVAGPPVAGFTANKTTVLRGGEVIFSDLSTNFPTSWNWTFEGGDPNTSNVQNPQVTYTTPGTFKVSLTVRNSEGASAPEVKEGFIVVSEEGLCNTLTNYFNPPHTPSLLRLKQFGTYTGYLTGHNSARSKAVGEKFTNPLGYNYISGVKIQFGAVYSKSDDATVTVTVWNARGVQGAPGSVIEQKKVLVKQIKEDWLANRVTTVSFDRETPIFSRAFHVGVELTYGSDSLAVVSSANGEATSSTSWIESSTGVWQPYSIAYGANIAMNIAPIVGMNPSVQVSASKLYVFPGEQVILNARGASIFVWNAGDNTFNNIPGPQISVNPMVTTTYETTGSGLDLCDETATTTIYVRQGEITAVNEAFVSDVTLFPNPGTNTLRVSFENAYRGPVQLQVRSILNQPVQQAEASKSEDQFEANLDTSGLAPGVYITTIKIGGHTFHGKWVKN